MKRKNQLEIYARRYHIQTVERVYDTRVKTTGQRQELKRYHQTHIQVMPRSARTSPSGSATCRMLEVSKNERVYFIGVAFRMV